MTLERATVFLLPTRCGVRKAMLQHRNLFHLADSRHKLAPFYSALIVIRLLCCVGDHRVKDQDLGSLGMLGSVNQLIHPEMWH